MRQLACLVGKQYEVNHSLVEFPCRCIVQLDISASGTVSAVVHTKAHLVETGTTIILCHRSPRVTERIDTIPLCLCYPHALTYLADADVYICTEAVARRVPLMETEQVFVCWRCLVLLKQ